MNDLEAVIQLVREHLTATQHLVREESRELASRPPPIGRGECDRLLRVSLSASKLHIELVPLALFGLLGSVALVGHHRIGDGAVARKGRRLQDPREVVVERVIGRFQVLDGLLGDEYRSKSLLILLQRGVLADRIHRLIICPPHCAHPFREQIFLHLCWIDPQPFRLITRQFGCFRFVGTFLFRCRLAAVRCCGFLLRSALDSGYRWRRGCRQTGFENGSPWSIAGGPISREVNVGVKAGFRNRGYRHCCHDSIRVGQVLSTPPGGGLVPEWIHCSALLVFVLITRFPLPLLVWR